MTKVNVRKVESILQSLSKIPEDQRPVDEKGNLDIAKLNEREDVKTCVKLLKAEGVKDRSHLIDLGFLAGAMILKFK